MGKEIINAMTIDVEDYFQVSAFEPIISKADWEKIPLRVDASTERLLEMFEQNNVHATFFTLGWVAEKFPELIKKIAAAGHEVASHGYWHKRATDQAPAEFNEEVDRTRKMLQDITGQPVDGYRAPSFSITKTNEWVYDGLAAAGYKYSSSVYPVKHDHYGIPDAPRFKYKTPQGLWELPLSTLKLGSRNIPISGGGYFRLYPYKLTAAAIKRFNSIENEPYIFYMHPWEIDSDQPRQKGLSYKTRFRHYLNLARVESRLERMLAEFNWNTLDAVINK